MWRLVAGIVSAVALGQAQAFDGLLLPEARHITGIVADSEGKPIASAQIDHSNDLRKAHQTDANGRFELDTRAPIFVIRKPGYRSEFVHTQEAEEIRITLQQPGNKRTFPSCSKSGSYIGIDGWQSTFRFPRVSDVKVGRQGRDIDYGARNYYIETETGPKGIMHGSGPMWSLGTPLDRDVWRSIKYEEITYKFGNATIIDARGQVPNGQRWRYLGMLGESASYSDVDEATAKVLDNFLDGVCSRSHSFK
jgi:hypothetical protein